MATKIGIIGKGQVGGALERTTSSLPQASTSQKAFSLRDYGMMVVAHKPG